MSGHPWRRDATPQDGRRKITSAQWDEILRRYNNGETATALAAEFGITRGHLYGTVGRRA